MESAVTEADGEGEARCVLRMVGGTVLGEARQAGAATAGEGRADEACADGDTVAAARVGAWVASGCAMPKGSTPAPRETLPAVPWVGAADC